MSISKSSTFVMLSAIVLFGTGYKVIASKLEKTVEKPVSLPVPLKSFPRVINDWTGRDVNLPESVLKTALNDDYLNRVFINDVSKTWFNLYIAYSARPRTMLGHRPDICYVGAGWVRDSTEQSYFTSDSGKEIECLIHRFHRPDENREELVVLNFYVVNGLTSSDEELFSGLQWRTPNIKGNIARYVAQVQISSGLENTVRKAAGEISQRILDYLPDEHGMLNVLNTSNTLRN